VYRKKDSSGFLLWQVTNLWQRETKALSPFDSTHSQFVILANTHWLSIQKTSYSNHLSQHTKIDPMTTSQVLRALQKKEFIRRKEHITDTRAKTIEITKHGKKRLKKLLLLLKLLIVNSFQSLIALNRSSTGICKV
jgi:DNA-binding MarR family transcriptional regulator